MKHDKSCGPLSGCNLGFALGITWGLTLAVMVLCGIWFHLGRDVTIAFGKIYSGIDLTFRGAGIAFVWGFVQGYVTGLVLSWTYNFWGRKCPCPSCRSRRK